MISFKIPIDLQRFCSANRIQPELISISSSLSIFALIWNGRVSIAKDIHAHRPVDNRKVKRIREKEKNYG